MFCTKCGAVVDEKTGVCPNCGACERAEEKAEKPDSKKKLHLGKATKTAKSYAVIFLGVHGVPGDDLHRRQYPEPRR